MPESERLDKFISNQKQLSRSQVKELIRKGVISVNGTVIKKADAKIFPQNDCIKISDEEIIYRKHIYIMLNKPQGYVCSTHDGLSPTVLSLVPEGLMRDGLFPAGRLDKDTVGFVLITDDGDLAHRMLSPKKHVPKTYACTLLRPFEEAYIDSFKSGLTLSDGTKCRPAKIIPGEAPSSAFVILSEGMFHQVKKMFEAVGNKVLFLKRLKIGGVALDENLPEGKCRELTGDEVKKLLLS